MSENSICQHACAACGVRALPLDKRYETFAVHTLETLKYDPDEVYAKCPEYQMVKSIILKELIRPSTAGQTRRTK